MQNEHGCEENHKLGRLRYDEQKDNTGGDSRNKEGTARKSEQSPK